MELKLAKHSRLTAKLKEKATLLSLAGDPVRLRILCVLFTQTKPCVSEIAEKLDMSVAAVSHHLQIMHKSGLLDSKRAGNNICYSMIHNQFSKDLKRLLCN